MVILAARSSGRSFNCRRLLVQRRAESEKNSDADGSTALGVIKCSQLNRELVLARLAFPDEFLGARIQVLLSAPDTFFERRGCWLVQDLQTAARAFGNVHLIQ